jgi:hypothetical protein
LVFRRVRGFRKHTNCFKGTDAVNWLISSGHAGVPPPRLQYNDHHSFGGSLNSFACIETPNRP